ncbi:MAG: histidine phosphatase family protein [Christensenellales bacterium]|jgi:broad specificity phosphatase PhoE
MRIILTRHGETDWNVAHRTQGMTDIELNANGVAQAHALAAALQARYCVQHVIYSPLKRARKTGEIIARTLNVPGIADERLKEFGFGVWEGLTYSTIQCRYPQEMQIWSDSPHLFKLCGAEPVCAFVERCGMFLQDMKKRYDQQTILAVGHALTCKAIITAALGLGPDRLHAVSVTNTSISEIDYMGNSPKLRLLNDACHIEGSTYDV